MSKLFQLPWMVEPLNEWSIVGMNHYFVDGQKRIYVAMVRGFEYIKEEGADTDEVWCKLLAKARSSRSTGREEKGR